ncbi:GNAT family N-acetyltransferase [Azomonas agilis]|uniref:GNAT family N-acetyltransferase n=1 Tax=Azomonas agilis TaxID=116849 RepID=UPI0014786BCC|nr:GNAT family N-acetyltransferase [Azomonas agilis]
MIRIREKKVSDHSKVADVIALATADLRSVYRRSRGIRPVNQTNEREPEILVAIIGEELVGTVEYFIGSDSIYVQGLAVHPLWRRFGVARALISSVKDIAIQRERLKLVLHTIKETGNPAVFAKLGFIVVDELQAEGFEGVDGKVVTKIEMVCVLRGS